VLLLPDRRGSLTLRRTPCERDVASEALDLFDEVPGLAFGVTVSEVIGAEVAVGLAGGELCQVAVGNECLTAARALVAASGLEALVLRRGVVGFTRIAAVADSSSAKSSHLDPSRVLPDRRLPADGSCRGTAPPRTRGAARSRTASCRRRSRPARTARRGAGRRRRYTAVQPPARKGAPRWRPRAARCSRRDERDRRSPLRAVRSSVERPARSPRPFTR